MNNEKNAHKLYSEWQGLLTNRNYEGAGRFFAKNYPNLESIAVIKKEMDGLILVLNHFFIPAYKELQEIKKTDGEKAREIMANLQEKKEQGRRDPESWAQNRY